MITKSTEFPQNQIQLWWELGFVLLGCLYFLGLIFLFLELITFGSFSILSMIPISRIMGNWCLKNLALKIVILEDLFLVIGLMVLFMWKWLFLTYPKKKKKKKWLTFRFSFCSQSVPKVFLDYLGLFIELCLAIFIGLAAFVIWWILCEPTKTWKSFSWLFLGVQPNHGR